MRKRGLSLVTFREGSDQLLHVICRVPSRDERVSSQDLVIRLGYHTRESTPNHSVQRHERQLIRATLIYQSM
jgi:hypothetical protein